MAHVQQSSHASSNELASDPLETEQTLARKHHAHSHPCLKVSSLKAVLSNPHFQIEAFKSSKNNAPSPQQQLTLGPHNAVVSKALEPTSPGPLPV
jgi:hypothetical protein